MARRARPVRSLPVERRVRVVVPPLLAHPVPQVAHRPEPVRHVPEPPVRHVPVAVRAAVERHCR